MTSEAGTQTSPLPLAAGRWEIDTNHSEVGFTIRHLGISKVRGHFGQVDAELVVGETIEGSSITATVALASIDTGNPQRDEHVRSAELLDVASRPTMTFRSTKASGKGEEWVLEGDLTIGEVTKSVTFEVEFGGAVDFADNRKHAGFEAKSEIRRSDFGLNFGAADALLGDVVKIQLDAQFLSPA
ncbi:YceI family protein [Streptomyces sp. NBC_01465]|uniref:YceI family protein n=1 Tax=Streptomyces sp. NBC_01465 TaxID=2903878 RepID=UPI002E2F2334|nr:YceI family protein [Streptomyces sp. NBC_01465]